jgi:hypothetical protein
VTAGTASGYRVGSTVTVTAPSGVAAQVTAPTGTVQQQVLGTSAFGSAYAGELSGWVSPGLLQSSATLKLNSAGTPAAPTAGATATPSAGATASPSSSPSAGATSSTPPTSSTTPVVPNGVKKAVPLTVAGVTKLAGSLL